MASDAKQSAAAAAPASAKTGCSSLSHDTSAAVVATVKPSLWKTLKVCAFQGLSVAGDISANVDQLEAAAAQAAAQGAQLLLFPELFLTGYCIGPDRLRALALEPRADANPHFARIAAAARKHRIALCPAYPERGTATDGSGVVYNSVCCFDATGACVANYRKTHLWSQYEQRVFTAGDSAQLRAFTLATAQQPPQHVRCGFLICYDVEFPEPARVLFAQGVEVLLVPTALSSGPCAAVIPRCIVPARASENLAFVVYANFAHLTSAAAVKPGATAAAAAKDLDVKAPDAAVAGSAHAVVPWHSSARSRAEYDGRFTYCGLSAIVTPEGADLARGTGEPVGADGTGATQLLFGTLDSALRVGYEERNPYRFDRRPELYGAVTAQTAKPAPVATAAATSAAVPAKAADVVVAAAAAAPASSAPAALPAVVVNCGVKPRFCLFGDSITQQSFTSGGFGQALADRYVRHADVVNRGFSGYNVVWAQLALDRMVSAGEFRGAQRPALMTVFLGANDASLHGVSTQHVPLPQFEAGLVKLVATARAAAAADGDAKSSAASALPVVLITPPPVDSAAWLATMRAKCKGDVANRTEEETAKYAAAVLRAAKTAGVPAIDLHSALVTRGAAIAGGWKAYFYDGLHLNASGYAVLFELLMDTIATHWPLLHVPAPPVAPAASAFPDMPFHFPPFDHINPDKPAASFP